MGNLLLPFTIGYHLKTRTPGAGKPETLELNTQEITEGDPDLSTASSLESSLLIPPDNKVPSTRLGRAKELLKAKTRAMFDCFKQRKTSDSPTKKRPQLRQDGFISSLMLFLVMVSSSFSVSLARWISEEQTLGVTPFTAEFNLLFNMILACCIMWAFCLHKSERFGFMKKYVLETKKTNGLGRVLTSFATLDETQLTQNSRGGEKGRHTSTSSEVSKKLAPLIIKYIRSGIQHAIPLIGILIFFILGMFLDIIRIIAHVDCMPVYRKCNEQSRYIISICTHAMRIIFQATVLVFTFKFHNKALKQCTTIRYLLLIILATMSAMWFDTLLYESSEIFAEKVSGPERFGNDAGCFNSTVILPDINTTTSTGLYFPALFSSKGLDINSCLNRTTDLYIKDKELSPYFYPLHIEFALMVCEIIFHLYFNVRDEDPPGDKQGRQSNSEGEPGAGETDRLLTNNTTGYGTLSTHTPEAQPETKNPATPESDKELSSILDAPSSFHWSSETPTREPPAALTEENPMEASQRSGTMSFPTSPALPYDEDPPNNVRRRNVSTNPMNPAVCTDGDMDQIDVIGDPGSHTATVTPDTACHNTQRRSKPSASGSKQKKCAGKHAMKGLPRVFAPFMVLNILLITLGGLTYLDTYDTRQHAQGFHDDEGMHCKNVTIPYHWRQSYELIKLVYFVILVLTIIVGFVACKNSLPKFKPYQGLDMLIPIVTFGFFIHAFLTIIADVNYLRGTHAENNTACNPNLPHSFAFIALVSKVFNVVEVYLQTALYMHSGRIKFPRAEAKARTVLKNCLVALALSNLSFWFVDSFVEVKNPHLEPIPAYYYTNTKWHLISHIFIPLSLFYRFNSFLLILSVFLEH